jgi:hypothetical protein
MRIKAFYVAMALALVFSLVASVLGFTGSSNSLPTVAAATTWYEQSTSATVASGVFGSYQNCQTFTPAVSHYFDRTSFSLYKKGSTTGFTMTIALYNVDPGTQKPVSPALCSTTFDASSLTTTATWYEIGFAYGYPVSAGTQYAMVLSCASGNTSNLIYVRCKSGGSAYSGGLRALSSDGGASWTTYSDYDLAFKEGRSDLPLPSQCYVATAGSNITGNGSPGNPWQTIQFAIDNPLVLDGSTINVAAGTYDETINVDGRSNLSIVGADEETTILKSSATQGWNIGGYGTSRMCVLRVVNSTDIGFSNMTFDFDLVKANFLWGVLYWDATGTLDGNTLKNVSIPDVPGGYYEFVIGLRTSTYTELDRAQVTITNNTFVDTGRVCIHAHDFVDLDISGNTFYKTTDDFGYAMEIGSESVATIEGNTIYGYDTPAASDNSSSAGIYIENCFTSGGPHVAKNVVVENNEVYDCQWALHVGNEFDGYSGDVDIALALNDNNFHDNLDGGVIIADEDKESGSSVSVSGSGNSLANNGDYGYYVYTNGDGDITIDLAGEAITGHGTGVYVEDLGVSSTSSYSVSVTDSDISGNTDYGVNNTVTTVTVDATGNWWGDPSGPSGVGPGTGDAVSANVDYDPWTANRTWYVATTGSDLTGDGSQGNPWQTIGHAVATAYSGDSIDVAAGTYNVDATIVVNKALTISGPVGGGAIVQGTNSAAVCIFELAASNVTLENLEITHNALPPFVSSGWAELPNSLVRVPASLGVTGIAITGNKVYVPAQSGAMSTWNGVAICVGSSTTTGISITGNTIYNTRNGVVVQYSNTAAISGNIIYDTKGGVMNYTNTQADADNRMVSGNSWGTTHNEWDIVWNTAYYVPDYQQSVLGLSGANNDARVVDRRAADAAACAALTGNRSHIFVDDDGTQSTAAPAAGNINQKFTTITLGVSAVVPGGTVYVAAGTYTEQVTINKSLHLIGSGIGSSIIQAPGTLPASSDPASAIVIVSGSGVNAELTGFTVTGPGPSTCGSIRAGIYVYDGANADIHHNLIQDIRDSVFSGCQNGVAISVGRQALSTSGTATIAYNTIVGYQKGGIVIDNAGSAATIENNVVTGAGTTDVIGQNGIQISRGATAALSGNTVTGNSFHLEGSEWDWCGAGILLYESGAVTLSGGNTVSNNDQNLYIYATTGAVTLGTESLGPTTAPVDYGYDIINLVSSDLDATDVTFVGAESDDDVEALVWHQVDDASCGLVTWTPLVTAPNGWYEQYTTGDGAASGVMNTSWLSQTFTPTTSHTLDTVSLYLYKVGSPTYTVTIGLYAAGTDDKPTSPVLASTTFLASSLTTTATWYEYEFSTGYAVTAGTKYALVLSATEGASGTMVYWRVNTAGTYSGGMKAISANQGTTWTTSSASDFMFREGQNPPAWYEQYTTGASAASGVMNTSWLSQTFTPVTTHAFNAVSLQLYKAGSPTYTVTIGLYATTGDVPTGSPLASTTFLASSLTTTATWYEFQFSTGYEVAAGTKYAIVLSATDGATGNMVYWRLNPAGTYSRGMKALSANQGTAWTTYSAHDFMFKEGGSQ